MLRIAGGNGDTMQGRSPASLEAPNKLPRDQTKYWPTKFSGGASRWKYHRPGGRTL